MKAIQPLEIWKDGGTQTAVCLKLYISFDNLEDTAALVYQLCDAENIAIVESKIFIIGGAYTNWGASGDSNNEAYVLAAESLNLTLL